MPGGTRDHLPSSDCVITQELSTEGASNIDTTDNLLQLSSLESLSHTSRPVQWTIGGNTVDRDFVQFVTVYILIFIIATTSLANLSIKEDRPELWASLLSMMCGIIVPQPKYPKRKERH